MILKETDSHNAMDGRGRMNAFAGVVLIVAIAAGACDLPEDEPHVNLSFVNDTDSLICYFGTPAAAAAARNCNEVMPHTESVWAPECAFGHFVDTAPRPVVLTVGLGGREIYNKAATCGQWEDSGATIIIDQRGGEFVVTDGLPTDTPASSP